MDQENNNTGVASAPPVPVQVNQNHFLPVFLPPFQPVVLPRPPNQFPVPTEDDHKREVWMSYNQGYNEGFTKGYNTAMSKAGYKKGSPISQKYAKKPRQKQHNKPTYNHFGKLRTKQQNHYQTQSNQKVVFTEQSVNTPPSFKQHEGVYRQDDLSNVWNNAPNTNEWN